MAVPALLTLEAAAATLGKTTDWLAREASGGRIPSRKIGRTRMFAEADLEAYLERRREGGDPWVATSARRRRSA